MGEHDGPQPLDPEVVRLQELRRAVVAAEHDLGSALKSPAGLMHAGEAWTGSAAAREFAGELGGRSDELPGLVRQVLSAIDAELDRLAPPTEQTTLPDHGSARG